MCLLVLAAFLAGPAAVHAAQAPLAAAPPESIACETTKYLIGLRQQGLFYLQAEYMKACLPKGLAEQAWYQREQILARVLQAESVDARLPLLGQADDAAAQAIEAETRAGERAAAQAASPRSILWRADRAQTWYYLASRPLFEQVLFYGPTPTVRRGLKEAAERGDKAYEEALAAAEAYLEQIAGTESDESAAQSRQLDLNAFSLSRQLQFEHSWATLHRAVSLNRGDLDQALLGGQVVRSLQDQQLLQEPRDGTPIQAEALLMAAIASRLQTDWPAARGYLEAATKAVAALPASAAAQSVQWVGVAAAIESVRLQIDQGQFAQAIESIDQQRRRIEADPTLDATVKLAREASLAMLNFEACSLASDTAAADRNRAAQASFANQRFDALAALAAESGDARQGIYQMVGDRLGEVAGVAGLPPFAKVVFAAKWIRDRKFDQALGAADSLDRDDAAMPGFLKQDAVFFKAACLQELNQSLQAAQEYLRFARDFPADKRAPQAMLTGLSLLARQQDVLEDAATRTLLTDVGDMLLRSSAPEVEKYRQAWLPLVAEANLREGRYDRAAEMFQMIPKDSRQYGLALVGRILAISGKLRFAAAAADKDKVRGEAEAVIREAVDLAAKLPAESPAPVVSRPAATRPAGPNVQAARLLLEAARLSIDTLGDADRALKLLDGAEGRWQQDPALLAQLLNVRIQALQKGGKLDQATQLVQQFMSARPDAAGPLLARLLGDMQREIEQQRKLGRAEQAGKYSSLAVNLAAQLDTWAADHPDAVTPDQRYAIRYRLARSLLQAEQSEQALGVFEDLYRQNAERSGGQARDAGVLEGRAACLFDLRKWPEARQAYLDIWRRATPRSEIWWQAILRSLQCSVQLRDEDPNKILKVIRQHKDLYPDMGGTALARQFDEISLEMLKRIEASQASQPAKK